MSRFPGLVLVLGVAALLLASGGQATPDQATTLHGRVGPGFSISLTTEAGARVTHLDPGTYDIEVQDLSDEHNFHLLGPGVDKATEVGDSGRVTWTVTVRDGTYRYQCDPHQATMNGSFTVGNAQPAPPPSSTPPAGGGGAVVTSKTKLVLTSGPGFTITLETSAGKTVKTMKTGTYTLVVRDRSRIHDARVVAPGFDRRTTPLTFTGTQTWKVKLARPGTFRFLCDPHAITGMKGSAKIVK
jgi:plastocyanin